MKKVFISVIITFSAASTVIHAKENPSFNKEATEKLLKLVRLHSSRKMPSAKQVQKLINKGADPTIALMEAALSGNIELCSLLLEKGAEVNAKCGGKGNSGVTPLICAVFSRSIELCSILLDKGANIEAKDDWGWTPLHQAASDGNEKLCRFLIDKGANIHAKTNAGTTPLALAEEYTEPNVVALLSAHK